MSTRAFGEPAKTEPKLTEEEKKEIVAMLEFLEVMEILEQDDVDFVADPETLKEEIEKENHGGKQ